ncbi:hypothetical protein EDC01DRAFT_667078 [Geopyxis carbonaria]|nr:hypothetical protein EDC01DRAFT_667078 [Geopyxis carbonaria]
MEERHFSALLSAVFKVEAGMEPWLYYQSGNDRNISCIPRKSNTPKKNLERNPQAGAQMSTLSRKSKTDRRILNKGRLLKSFPKKRDSPVEKTDMKTDERGESSVWPGSKNQSSSPARKRSPQKPKDTRKRKGNKQHRGIKNTKTNNSSVVT